MSKLRKRCNASYACKQTLQYVNNACKLNFFELFPIENTICNYINCPCLDNDQLRLSCRIKLG